MRTAVLFTFALALVAGCNQVLGIDDFHRTDAGGGDPPDAPSGPPDAEIPDAEVPDADPSQCNPIEQTGCAQGEKCTWIQIDDQGNGRTGCAADGAVAVGGACTQGPPGETTGYDNCARGGMCVAGECLSICSLTPDSCGAIGACTQYAGVFADVQNLGMCAFSCDPVSQVRTFDGATACGSPNPAAPTKGCYGTFEGPFTCSTVPSAAADLTQDEEAYGPAPGQAYLNGCAPGYMPMAASNEPGTILICVAYCRPDETSLGDTAGAAGVPGSGYTCPDRGANAHECKFIWLFDQTPTVDHNGIGVCWQPADFVGDWDQNGSTEPFPACTTLPNTDTNGDSVPEHLYWACAPYPGP